MPAEHPQTAEQPSRWPRGCLALPAPEVDGGRCGGWSARVEDGRLAVSGSGDRHDWWRAAATALWAHLDATGTPADPGDAHAPR